MLVTFFYNRVKFLLLCIFILFLLGVFLHEYLPVSIELYSAFIFSLIVLLLIVFRVIHFNSPVDGRILILLSFFVVYPLSAVAHLIDLEDFPRGFFDIARSNIFQLDSTIYYSLTIVLLAFISLWFSLGGHKYNNIDINNSFKMRPFILLSLGIFFTILGGLSIFIIQKESESIIEGLLTVDRAREYVGGLGRYVFMSQWMSWGITFIFVYLISKVKTTSIFIYSIAFFMCSILIVGITYWLGTRGLLIVSLLPLIMFMERINKKFTWINMSLTVLLILIYWIAVTYARTDVKTLETISLKIQVINVFDWHVGRFSMVGLGIELVGSKGYAFGKTLFEGLVTAINAPFILFSLPTPISVPQGITSVVGEYLVGDPGMNAIVPGTICELYYNFGVFGVISGYIIVGKLVNVCVKIMHTTVSFGVFSIYSYCLALLCITFIPGTTTVWIYYLITWGLPAICLYLFENINYII